MASGILAFASEFAEYLQKNEFAVSESSLRNMLLLLSENGIDLYDENAVIPALCVTLAKDQDQFESIREFLRYFMAEKRPPEVAGETEKELQEHTVGFVKKIETLDRKIQKLREEKEEIDKEKPPEIRIEEPVLKERKAKKLKEDLKGVRTEKEETKEIVKQALVGKPLSGTAGAIKASREELKKKAEEAIRKGDAKKAMAIMEISKSLKVAADKERKAEENQRKEREKRKREKDAEIQKLQAEKERERREYEKTKQEIEKRLEQLKQGLAPTLTLKGKSRSHRPEFYGKGAVQLYQEEIVKLENKTFKSLTEQEKHKIYYYIKQNLLAFKTRMTRNIYLSQRMGIDLEKTVQESIRTGGVPIRLFQKVPKRSKANLVLILDVSGSCKSASEMMLTFIGILKEIFPRGCRAFAFVNSLYDISGVYEAAEIDEAVRETLDMIPRTGQYSNYESPLQTMWEEYRRVITKDSMVIFIGDARNNKNASGEEYMKNICRKAKCAYWLNTETADKWNTKDSIARVYGKYAKMYEVVNIGELLGFISRMK